MEWIASGVLLVILAIFLALAILTGEVSAVVGELRKMRQAKRKKRDSGDE